MVGKDGKIISGLMTGPLVPVSSSRGEKLEFRLPVEATNPLENAEQRLVQLIENNYFPKEKNPGTLNPIETVICDLLVGSRNYSFRDIKDQVYNETLAKILGESMPAEDEKKGFKNSKSGKINPLFKMAARNIISMFNDEEIVKIVPKCNSLYDLKLLLFIDRNMESSQLSSRKYEVYTRLGNSSLENAAAYSYKLGR